MDNNEGIFFMNMKDLKRMSAKAWMRERIDDVTKFYSENREFVLLVAVPAVKAITDLSKVGIKSIAKNQKAKKEYNDREHRIYDPSLHCYWELKRKMTNTEKAMVAVRRRNGEKLSDILFDMRLL